MSPKGSEMATRISSEVEQRRSPVRRKRTHTRLQTQANYALVGLSSVSGGYMRH